MTTPPTDRTAWFHRPIGPATTAIVAAVVVLIGPAWLFADALGHYRMFSDDFAYVSSSRSLGRTIASLFEPHNTHIVPSWRILTFSAVAIAGSLAGLPSVLAKFAYLGLVLVLFAMGRLVARETGKASVGLAAMVAAGTTSVAWSSTTWYSSGQTFWAALGVLAMLNVLQTWRLRGGGWRLVLAALLAWVAGGFWTIGHAAGPVGSIYLWADGRPRSRIAALVPILATAFAVLVALGLGGRKIDGKVSFHGRSSREALNVGQGALHTLQAIPENLIFGNLGLAPVTDEAQSAVLCLGVLGVWSITIANGRRPSPLEWAGATLSLSSYLVEWSFRGYFTFANLRGVVPWYDTIPHLGAILFASCWIAASRDGRLPSTVVPLQRINAIAILAFQLALIGIHQARVDLLTERNVPTFRREDAEAIPTARLRRIRARELAEKLVSDQSADLKRLDRIQSLAARSGIGREAIRRAFGRIGVSEMPEVYDPVELLDLPISGGEAELDRVRATLGVIVKEKNKS